MTNTATRPLTRREQVAALRIARHAIARGIVGPGEQYRYAIRVARERARDIERVTLAADMVNLVGAIRPGLTPAETERARLARDAARDALRDLARALSGHDCETWEIETGGGRPARRVCDYCGREEPTPHPSRIDLRAWSCVPERATGAPHAYTW